MKILVETHWCLCKGQARSRHREAVPAADRDCPSCSCGPVLEDKDATAEVIGSQCWRTRKKNEIRAPNKHLSRSFTLLSSHHRVHGEKMPPPSMRSIGFPCLKCVVTWRHVETKEKLGASCAEPGCASPFFFSQKLAVKSRMSVVFFQVMLCNRLEQNATQSEFRFWQSSEQHVKNR